MPWYAALCHPMRCHATPCHAMPCHAMPCHAVPCRAVPCHTVTDRAMSYRHIPCHHGLCRAIPSHPMMSRTVPCCDINYLDRTKSHMITYCATIVHTCQVADRHSGTSNMSPRRGYFKLPHSNVIEDIMEESLKITILGMLIYCQNTISPKTVSPLSKL